MDLSSLDDLRAIAATKFPGQPLQHVTFKAKLDDGRSEEISSDADLLNAIHLAPIKKNSKNLTIKLIPHPKKTIPLTAETLPDGVQPPPVNQIPKPANPLNRIFNELKNRAKDSFDNYSVSDEKELHCETPNSISFTEEGPHKLYTYEGECAFDVILDHQENTVTRMYLKFRSTSDPAILPQKTVLQIYADMSVQLWSDSEVTLLGYGWINANSGKVNLHLTLDCENGASVKLQLSNPLSEVTNCENNQKLYWLNESAVIGIIPQNQFKFPMGCDGIFLARSKAVKGWDEL